MCVDYCRLSHIFQLERLCLDFDENPSGGSAHVVGPIGRGLQHERRGNRRPLSRRPQGPREGLAENAGRALGHQNQDVRSVVGALNAQDGTLGKRGQ